MKNVSCTWVFTGTEASISPDKPPIRNTKKNPKTHNIGNLNCRLLCHMVAIQQKNCDAVGNTIISVAAVKKLSPICGKPVANIWCTQTPNPRKLVDTTEIRMTG